MGLAELILPRAQAGRALWLLAGSLAVLAAAWTFQALGYAPCELCLAERNAFYAAAPLAALAAVSASRSRPGIARALFVLIALVFLANVALAFYHVGVEQHWWPGPTACTGALTGPVSAGDLMTSLNSVHVVNCDEVQLRLLGLSLAGWDVVASLGLALYAALAARLGR
ncbi:disulfide bond formation protein DsbB [Roseiarcus fermentans]|uniref:Disulfide bond formation protein DsbB n=1 Tax=Roseiarcus fermentans TaxID=1473586 RepID=A0A366FN96_9HYPH|nr:disulfide bond formation protein B [Roseiarcus fermentans]RBP15510.1 disulfide bond formation protein DsbB [Roseiarcus fermentans]